MFVFKNIVDVVEVAVRIERQGIQLYNSLSATVRSPKAKDAFSMLAADEEKHAGIFRAMLEKIADYTPRYTYPGEYGLFIDDMASGILEKAKRKAKASAGNITKALDLGIGLEKETILFYSELASDKRLGKTHKEILGKVIAEERTHWKTLVALKNKLKV